jgi:hypothetical protein
VREDRQVGVQTLGDHQPIKRITVVMGTRTCEKDGMDRDRQIADLVQREMLVEIGLRRLGQFELAEAELDGNLPGAGVAEKQLDAGFTDSRQRGLAQLRAVVDQPEHRVGVDQRRAYR